MIKDEYKVILFSIIAGGAVWVIDAIMDTLIFYHMPFYSLLIADVPSHEIYIRVLIIISFIIYGFIISRNVAKAKESENRYRQLFDNINDAIFVISASQENPDRFMEVNEEACKRLGYTREEMLKLSITDIDSLEEVPLVPGRLEKLLAEKHILFETVHVAKDGRRIPVEVNAHLVDYKGGPVSLGLARDITARRQAEAELHKAHEELEQRVIERTAELTEVNRQLLREMEEHRRTAEKLRESEVRFRTLFQTAGSLIMFIDAAGCIREFNREAELAFGYTRDEVVGKDVVELLVPEGARELAAAGEKRVLDGKIIRGSEFSLKLRDGTERMFLWNANPLLDSQGQPAGIIVVGHDISERIRAEEAIKAERQRLFALMEGLPAYVCLYASDYSCSFVNRCFRERFGDPGGRPCYEFLHGCKTLCEKCPTFRAFEDQTPQEFEWTTADGHTYQLYDYPFADVDGSSAVLEMGIDITARKRAEEALKESRQNLRHLYTRLLKVQEDERRRISQELHDDMGQTLLGMKLRISGIKEKLGRLKPRKDQKGLVADCNQLLHFLQAMVENIRQLSRDLSPAILEDLGLAAAVKNLCDEFCRNHGNIESCACNIEEIDDALPPPDQINFYRIIQESFTNIGKHSEADRLALTVKRNKTGLTFELWDNGIGFDPEEILRRQPGAKGMGLATLDERVRNLGGTLRIDSKKGEGTRLRFEVPAKGRGQGPGGWDQESGASGQ
ncbi:MAG: PAS domain S-box protein [Deltaproteobacteria bacterium]|nr:MAG: PAS domain S-box protein [Deltaproteobacteria bacterium]